MPVDELCAIISSSWKNLSDSIEKEVRCVDSNDSTKDSSVGCSDALGYGKNDFFKTSESKERADDQWPHEEEDSARLKDSAHSGTDQAEARHPRPVIKIATALRKNAKTLSKIIRLVEELLDLVKDGTRENEGDRQQVERVEKILRWYVQMKHVHNGILKSLTPRRHCSTQKEEAFVMKKQVFANLIGGQFFAFASNEESSSYDGHDSKPPVTSSTNGEKTGDINF